MVEHQKIFRIFQLLARLRSQLGCTINEITEDFGVAERTVERYIALLKDIGFTIEVQKGRYKIPAVAKSKLEISELFNFTIEEAQIIKQAVENQPIKTPLQQSIMSKLYALAEMPELADTVFNQLVSKNISNLCHAIKYKEQVVLKKYQSLNSATTKDRLVEPLRLYRYNRYLMAYEPLTKQTKDFKIERIGSVDLTGEPALYHQKTEIPGVDIFGMTGTQKLEFTLRLSARAAALLKEEFPDATVYISHKNDQSTFTHFVYSWKGIGRFILGLPGEIEMIAPPELKAYVVKKAKELRA